MSTPTIGEVITGAIDARLADVQTSMPGKIVRYDSATQIADVQPMVMSVYYDEEGERIAEPYPVICNVPCQFPGGGGYRITFPVAAGDPCLLVFASCSLDKWLAKPGAPVPAGPIDPGVEHRHHLSDAVAHLGVRPRNAALASAPTDRMTVGYDTGAQIHITATGVNIGSNTDAELEWAARGETVHDFLVSLRGFVAGAAGADYFPFGCPSLPSTFKSTTIKVKK